MNLIDTIRTGLAAWLAPAPAPAPATAPAATQHRESVQIDPDDEAGWKRLTADGGAANLRDLSPLSQERMQRLAEFLWQSNLLANRLVEIPLAYLLAEGVQLQCQDEEHQKLLNRFWADPINAWPLKLMARARDLALTGEQCYVIFRNEASGFLRLGYLDPRRIGEVVTDPDNPEQPIGVITRKDARGRYKKYRVVLGTEPDEELFSARTTQIRETFADGDVLLYQINKLPTGSRGRSDMLGQMDWIDAYDEFMFGELDRTRFLRAFVWDLMVKGGTPEDIARKKAEFKPPEPNSVYVHNDLEELEPKSPGLQAADTSEAARLFRNHVLAGSTIPEHWYGGGGDVNRAAASEMGEPTFKVFTARQTFLKLMLEHVGRMVLASQPNAQPEWDDAKWKVQCVFPELASKDVTKFAAAMREVSAACILLMHEGLLTQERALTLIADVAQRFGAEIDVKAELAKAQAEHQARQAKQAERERDAMTQAGDGRDGAEAAELATSQRPADRAAAQAEA